MEIVRWIIINYGDWDCQCRSGDMLRRWWNDEYEEEEVYEDECEEELGEEHEENDAEGEC